MGQVSNQPAGQGRPGGNRPRARVSLTVIVKNEERNIGACLKAVSDMVDEIVVVDTGSKDRTKEIALRFKAKVIDFPWRDDFAAARNEALRHATGDWILWLDADDRIDEENRPKLHALLAGLGNENRAYILRCLCPPDGVTGGAAVVSHPRLFRRHPNLRWQYRVHEQILPSVQQLGGLLQWADVVIHHVGYHEGAERRRKVGATCNWASSTPPSTRTTRLCCTTLAERAWSWASPCRPYPCCARPCSACGPMTP